MQRELRPRPDALGRPFWTLVGASGASNLADGIFKLALPLIALTYTRSPALVAGVELARSLPWLLAALQVGAVVDRIDRRLAMARANVARAVFVTVPAAALAMDSGSLWLLYLAAVGTGMSEVVYDTAAQSFLPSLVPKDQLDRANGRLYAVEMGAQQFAGPPLAGALVAVSLVASLAVPSVLWVVAVVGLLQLRGTFRPERTGPRTTIRADVRQGLDFLLGHRILRTMAVMVGVGNLASSAATAVFVLFAVGPESPLGLSEPGFGLLFTLFAAGAMIGSVVTDRLVRRIGRAHSLTMSVVGMSLFTAAAAVTTNVPVIGAASLVSGVAVMVWNITTVSYRQRVIPDHLLGRVNSAYRLLAWGTMPVGAALGGALGEWFGVRSVFVVMTVASLSLLIPDRVITEESLREGEST